MAEDEKEIHVGAQFASFQLLEAAMKRFEQQQMVTYWIRDCRKACAYEKRQGDGIVLNQALVYGEIKWACIKGGGKFATVGNGKRLNSRTYREDCPSFVRFKASSDGRKLNCVAMDTNHNHLVSEETFAYLPKQRKLTNDEQKHFDSLLVARPNKKILQQHIVKSTGKMVTLKDIHNYAARIQPQHTHNLEDIVKDITGDPGITVDVISDDEKVLTAIYFQTETMSKLFSAYPELLMVDATYKLNDLRMPVFLQLVQDGNGESEIISVFVMANECGETLSCLLDIFKKHNPDWVRVQTVLSDKDFMERSVYTTAFPQVKLQLCLFHVLRSMNREIHVEKMKIRIEDKNMCLELLQKLAYSKSEEEYQGHLKSLKQTKIQEVIQYFMNNWHAIREEWVVGLKKSCNFGNNTNNRTENANGVLKQVIDKFSTLRKFFADLKVALNSLRLERDRRRADALLKRPTLSIEDDLTDTCRYARLLTPYAYNVVVKQLQLSEKIQIDSCTEISTISTSCGEVTVTATSCSCGFSVLYLLPCRHVFAMRRRLGLGLYFTDLVADRWHLLKYCENTKPLPSMTSTESSFGCGASSNTVSVLPRPVTLSQSQKYKSAFVQAQKLAELASEPSTNKYKDRYAVLVKLASLWEQDQDATVIRTEQGEVEPGKPNFIDASFNITIDEEQQASVTAKEQMSVFDKEQVSMIDEEQVNETDEEQVNETDEERGSVTNEEQGSVTNEEQACEMDHDEGQQEVEYSTLRHAKGKAVLQERLLKNDATLPLSAVTLPPRMKKRGRPKGSYLTAIGVSKKKKCGQKPVKFFKRTPIEKDRGMLGWFVNSQSVEAALSGTMLTVQDVKQSPNDVSSACLDENINIDRIRKYFCVSAWKQVLMMINKVRERGWLCRICCKDVDTQCSQGQPTDCEDISICCDGCLEWYHLPCAGVRKALKCKTWFCKLCY